MLSPLKARVIANACITRYARGEGELNVIIDSYGLVTEDRELVLAEVYSKRPDIEVKTEV